MISVLLDDAEPVRTVGRVGGFVDPRVELDFDEATYFLIYSGWDGYVPLRPRLVWNGRDVDGREEVLPEVATLWITPGESGVLDAHETVHKRTFGG